MARTSFTSALVTLTTVALLLGGALFPAIAAQSQEVSLGFVYDENFDGDDGGMTASGPVDLGRRPLHTDVWELGTPTSGPGFAASGDRAWATRLAGPYGPYECGAIMSPPIDLTGATSASFSIQEWHHMQQFTRAPAYWTYDAGMFFVTTDGGQTLTPLDPVEGTDGVLSTYSARCMDGASSHSTTAQRAIGGPNTTSPPPAVYSTLSGDLTPFVNQVVQVVFSFGSDSSTHRDGWYIDDFAVTVGDVTTVEDFEDDDHGFTHVTTYQIQPRYGWTHGNAGDGPNEASPLWGTNVAGTYGFDECAALDTPPLELGSSGQSARLTWDHHFRSNSVYAAGIVLVGTASGWEVVTPETGYPGSTSGGQQAGLLACLGVDASQKVFSGLHESTNAAMKPLTADLTPWVGQEVVVRFLFASTWSSANPSVQSGWYVDDVAIELFGDAEPPSLQPILDQLPSADPTMPPAWSTGGKDSTWAYGVAQNGPVGETVLATNLEGNHDTDECSYVVSPAVPGALLIANPNLVLDHWYEIYKSSFGTSVFSGGAVLVSTDNGATWEYVTSPDYDAAATDSDLIGCIQGQAPGAPANPMVFNGDQKTFETAAFDLSAYTTSPTVKVKLVFGSGIGIGRDGWYVRGVELGGVRLL